MVVGLLPILFIPTLQKQIITHRAPNINIGLTILMIQIQYIHNHHQQVYLTLLRFLHVPYLLLINLHFMAKLIMLVHQHLELLEG